MQQDFQELTQYLNQLNKEFDAGWLRVVFERIGAKEYGRLPGGFAYYVPLEQNYAILLWRRAGGLKVEFGLFYNKGRSCHILLYKDPQIQRFKSKIFKELNQLKDALEYFSSPITRKTHKITRPRRKKLEINLFDLCLPLIDKVANETKSEKVRIRGFNDVYKELKKQRKDISKNQIYNFLSEISVLEEDPDKPYHYITTQTEWGNYKSKLKKKLETIPESNRFNQKKL